MTPKAKTDAKQHSCPYSFSFRSTSGPGIYKFLQLETYSYLQVPPELAPFGQPGDLIKFAIGPGCVA